MTKPTVIYRSKNRFSDALWQIGEIEIAPTLLQHLCDEGTSPSNLNELRSNHPWADRGLWRHKLRNIVAVRSRFCYEKPQRADLQKHDFRPRYNASFNGSGEDALRKAVRFVRSQHRLGEDVPVGALWLSIAVDLDGTYDAYWGDVTEMRVIRRADQNQQTGLAIPMNKRAIKRYVDDGRRLADRQPHEFPWDLDDHWACLARRRWLRLVHVANREERIRLAILAAAREMYGLAVPNSGSN